MICRFCGAEISEDSVSCDYCGKKLTEADESAERPELKKSSFIMPEPETIAVSATDANFWAAFEMMEPKEAVEEKPAVVTESAVESETAEEVEVSEELIRAEEEPKADEPTVSDWEEAPVDPEKAEEAEEFTEGSPEDEVLLDKAGVWLGGLGKKVHTGFGRVGAAAREKAGEIIREIKEERLTWAVGKAKGRMSEIREERSPEWKIWSEEEEGELEQDSGFWYRSLRPEEEREQERFEREGEETARCDAAVESGRNSAVQTDGTADAETGRAGEDDREEHRGGDNKLNKTRVLGQEFEEEDLNVPEEEGGQGIHRKGSGGKKSGSGSFNRGLKIGIVVVLIVAVLTGGALFGMKTYKEHTEAQKYQNALTRAEQYAEAREYENAEAAYRKLLEAYPDRPDPYEGLANVYIAEQKYDDAINTVNEGVAQTGKSKTFTVLSEDLKALTSIEWREPFRRVLADNEWAVRRYDDENDCCVALCDVNGDKWPEMFFFTQEYYGYGKLHIYTYDFNTGGAREISCECPNRSTQYDDAFYDIENDNAGFIIYKKKEGNGFSISASFKKGSDAWQSTYEYTVDGMTCSRPGVTEARITASYTVSDDDKDNGKARYLQNGKKISYDKYIGEFRRVMDDIADVMFSKPGAGGDKEIWSRTVDMDDLSLTYDGAMKILDEDAQ